MSIVGTLHSHGGRVDVESSLWESFLFCSIPYYVKMFAVSMRASKQTYSVYETESASRKIQNGIGRMGKNSSFEFFFQLRPCLGLCVCSGMGPWNPPQWDSKGCSGSHWRVVRVGGLPSRFGKYSCLIDPKEMKDRLRCIWKKRARPLEVVRGLKSCLAMYILFIWISIWK